MSFLLKKIAHRWFGRGPVALRSFDEICTTLGEARGAHQPERFHGELAAAPADSCDYRPAHSLLGQSPEPDMLDGRPHYRADGLTISPRRRLLALSDAAIAGVDGVVYCPHRRIAVAETVQVWLQPPEAHPLLAAPGFPRAQTLSGRTLSLGSIGAEGFYHFLIESLPRLELVRPWLATIDHVLAPGRPGGFQEKWLQLAGVPHGKILWLEGLTHYRCEQLLFTSPLSRDCEPTPWLVQAVRSVLAVPVATAPGAQRVWISRGDAGARHLAWEGELLAALGGFTRVELAALAPAEHIKLLAGAAVVAGPHGAGFANLVFCAPGARSIELLPDARHRPVFGRLATAAGGRHAWAAVDFASPPRDLAALARAMNSFAA